MQSNKLLKIGTEILFEPPFPPKQGKITSYGKGGTYIVHVKPPKSCFLGYQRLLKYRVSHEQVLCYGRPLELIYG